MKTFCSKCRMFTRHVNGRCAFCAGRGDPKRVMAVIVFFIGAFVYAVVSLWLR